MAGADRVYGDMQALKVLTSGLPAGRPDTVLPQQDREHVVNVLTARFLPDAMGLMSHSDFAVPAMVAAMIAYVEASEIVSDPILHPEEVVAKFDLRFAQAQDQNLPNSLAAQLHKLEQEQEADETALAATLTGKHGSLLAGVYPYFTDTLVGTRQVGRHCQWVGPILTRSQLPCTRA